MGIPITEIIQSLGGGTPQLQGTWVHPDVAINLGQWLSARFAVQVSRWVREWMSGKRASRAVLPFHLRRYIANQKNVPRGHFSVLTEITLLLVAPLEALGYTLPEDMWPDISEGRMFAQWLRDHYRTDTDAMPTYAHEFEGGRASRPAKAYPNEWLAPFRDHFENVWIPKHAHRYFAQRDPKALEYLPKLLAAPKAA